MSITPWRTSPYGEDFRWRIVWQRIGLEMGVNRVADNLGVSASTVIRIVKILGMLKSGSILRTPDQQRNSPIQSNYIFYILYFNVQLYILKN